MKKSRILRKHARGAVDLSMALPSTRTYITGGGHEVGAAADRVHTSYAWEEAPLGTVGLTPYYPEGRSAPPA